MDTMGTSGVTSVNLNAHQVEIYTANLYIHGNVLGSFSRTSDLINRRDYDNFTVQNVSLAPLGQPGAPRPTGHPLLVARPHVHMIAVLTTPENASDPMLSGPLNTGSLASGSLASGSLTSGPLPNAPTGSLLDRLGKPSALEHRALRIPRPCYAFTSSFVISGLCHLMEGTTIEQLMDGQNLFFHLTQVTAYLTTQPGSPWRRDMILLNKQLIQAIYTTDLPAPAPPADAPQP
jgi:hypothetical protein